MLINKSISIIKAVKVLIDIFKLHGKALTLLRVSNDWKQVEVAKALDVTAAHISQCEKSKRKLSEIQTKKFIELIGTSEGIC